jgi:SSS family solute:Na+ symporter
MIDIAILIGIVVITIVVGIWKSFGVETGEDYIVAGRSMGLFILIGTLVMTEFNTTTLVAVSRFGYTAGIYGAMVCISLLFSYPVYGLIFAKRWKRINLNSITDFFDMRFGPKMKKITAILFIFSLLLFSAAYLKAASKIFAVALNLSEFWTAVILYAVVFLLTYWGGLVSVSWSNTAAFIITLIVIPIFFIFCWINGGGVEGLTQAFDPKYLGWHTFSMWKDPNLPFFLVVGMSTGSLINGQLYPWNAQRMFAAKDESTAYKGVIIAAICIFLFYLIPTVATSFVKTQFPNLKDSEKAIGYAIWYFMPLGLRGLMLAVVFQICQTTVSSIWNNAASLLAYDGYKGFIKEDATSKELLSVSRNSIIFLCIFSFVASLYVRRILDALYVAVAFRLCLNFACWAGFLWWRTSKRAVMIVAGVGIVGTFAIRSIIGGDLWIAHANSWFNIALFVLGIILVFALPSLPDEIVRKRNFYNKVGKPWIGEENV